MKRKGTVEIFLNDAFEIIKELDKDSWTDVDAEPAPIRVTKLYSALGYVKKSAGDVAADIYERFTGSELGKVKKLNKNSSSLGQFPYGKDLQGFKSRIGSTHPGLDSSRPDLYNLLEDVQPHKFGRSTIFDLCDNRNIAEHDSLDQDVQESDNFKVGTDEIDIMNFNGLIFGLDIRDTYVNGKRVIDNLQIWNFGEGQSIISGQVSPEVKVKRQIQYSLSESNVDLIALLKDSYGVILKLKNQVYDIL